jgi:dipeptidyl aminopeptidase/acylaminoacyl peptidase
MIISTTLLALVLAQTPSAKTLQVSPPPPVGTLDAGKLKGDPTELGWSPDGAKLFVQTSERDGKGMVKSSRFYVVSPGDGKQESVDTPPAWAAEYWAWKSKQFAPGSTTFGIQIKEDQKSVSATASPMGGSLAKGAPSGDPSGGGTSAEEVGAHAAQTQILRVVTLTVKGENVGEFVGVQFLAGYTFGWAPAPLAMIAYGNQAGHLAVMDQQGQKQDVDGTRNVVLPAWSNDGSKIAFLQKAGKNKYDLFVVTVRP